MKMESSLQRIKFFRASSESTNQATGELEGLLSYIAIETTGIVCIRSYSVVEAKRRRTGILTSPTGKKGSTVSELQSEQLPKTSKTCKTFFTTTLDFRLNIL